MSTVKFRGDLFENPGRAIKKGSHPGLQRLGAQIEATVRLNTPSQSGELKRSVSTKVWNDNEGVSVRSTLLTKRRTWSESGRRRGVKLAKAYGMWRKGKAKAREINKQNLMAADIARELNG